MKFKRIVLSLFISLAALLVSFGFVSVSNINAAGAFTLINGQVELGPDKSEEYRVIAQQLFSQLTINVSESGDLSGEAQVPFSFELDSDSYNGQASIKLKGTYDFEQRNIKGSFSYKHNRIKKHTFKSGNVTELEGSANLPNLSFNGKTDGDTIKIEFLNLGNVTYSGDSPGADGSKSPEDSNLTIVIPKNFFGGGAEDRRIEVKNGVINSTVPFRFRPSEDFTNAVIKGTYDPESGVLETTIVIAPHEEGADFLMEFDGTMKADLSKENTAGFITMGGNLWQWTKGEDKGPAGDFDHRVYYTVEYPPDQSEGPTDSKPAKEPVDSNLHFWLTTSSQPSGEDTNAFIKRPGSNELEKVNEKTRINVGDTIVNPPDGKILTIYPTDWPESGIGLQPGTNFTISDKAQLLTMGEFIYKSTKDPKSGLNMQYDSFEMQLAKLGAKLKGTMVVVKEDGETSSIKVIEGAAEVTDIKTGKTVEIGEGKMIAATDTGIGEVQAFDVNAENAKWKDFTDSIKKTNTGIFTNKNIIYILSGIIVAVVIVGFLLLKARSHNKRS